MLKDKFSKFFKDKNKELMNLSIMDGFVDIKGYKVSDDGSKKLIYHDCGDNVVTDWMRHTIMVMLTGSVFSKYGSDERFTSSKYSRSSPEGITFMNSDNHAARTSGTGGRNYDGYLINKGQYFWNGEKKTGDFPLHYSESSIGKDNRFALFPTKVLFGTGKEYPSWDILQTENEIANATWYTEMLNSYGGDVNTAKVNFDNLIELNCNNFSGSIAKNIYTGNGVITKMRTVNDPDSSSNIISTTSTMNKNYGVVGAIKSPYFDRTDDNDMLQTTLTDSGKLLKPINRGIGRPCFIYFNAPVKEDVAGNKSPREAWDDASSEVYLSKDNSSSYLNKITFKITMPAQSASDGTVGEFYPYNGYTLKQMGLYNDARMALGVAEPGSNSYPYLNMPCGTLLAIKNITAFDKTADVELNLTWTLTI